MKIVLRNGEEISFDVSKIVEAVSKASIRAEEREIERQISFIDLFAGCGGLVTEMPDLVGVDDDLIEIMTGGEIIRCCTSESMFERRVRELRFFLRQRLERKREEIRAIRRAKNESVTAMIKTAWQNRNRSVGRSSTSAVSDKMLLSIPTPPTAVAANRSLWRGGVVVANMG